MAGGQRYTPIDIEASIADGYTQIVQKERFTKQLSPYFRIDLSMSFRINMPRVAHIISFDIQNATNRKNKQSRYYNIYDKKIEYIYHLGMVPIFNYKIEF